MSYEDAGWMLSPEQRKEQEERRAKKAARLFVIMGVLGIATYYGGGKGLWIMWGMASFIIGYFTDWD